MLNFDQSWVKWVDGAGSPLLANENKIHRSPAWGVITFTKHVSLHMFLCVRVQILGKNQNNKKKKKKETFLGLTEVEKLYR